VRSIDLFSLIDRRRRRKLASTQRARRRLSRLSVGCGAFALLAVAAGLLAASLAYVDLVGGLPPLAQLPEMFDPQHGALKQPTRVYDRTGQHLLLSLENPGISRRYLTMDTTQPDPFSAQLIRVTLAALDANYWSGPGFSLATLTSPQPVTIPERLVDDLLLWREPQGLRRALRMRVMAAQVVARYGHVQVLEWYLNSAYYGHLAFGADSAARLYFDKPATELNLSEAALLVAASQAPALNPLDAPAAALERQRELLDLLLEQGVISADEMRQALVAEPRLARPLSGSDTASQAAAFSRIVLRGLTERFGSQRVERGGLRVITTLDYSLQLELACMTRTQLARLTGESSEVRLPDGSACVSARLLPTLPPDEKVLPRDLAASAAVFDPQTGQVLALMGDTTPSGEAYFLTPHAPGTLLTPFAAVTSFARGVSPANIAWDIPASLPQALSAAQTRTGHSTDQPGCAWRLPTITWLHRRCCWIRSGLPVFGGWRALLGFLRSRARPARPCFTRAGRYPCSSWPRPTACLPARASAPVSAAARRRSCTRDCAVCRRLRGQSLARFAPAETQAVVTRSLAYLAHDVLSDTTARWPSLGYPNPLEIGRPSGAKIGQVEDGSAVWTAGYTPQRVAVFWLGLPDAPEARLNPRAAAGMWHALMQHAPRGSAL
jgi:membrane peptidoglycan carboxypeptidase